MRGSINELAVAYARLGVRHWNTEPVSIKQNASSIGVDIATNVDVARRAVEQPFDPDATNSDTMKLIPMACGQKKVYAAFFAPWIASQDADSMELSFDLVVLQQRRPIAFRFEPRSTKQDTRHGYDHAQLSESLGKRQVELDNPLSPLPKTYPAFPIPSDDAVTRLLALFVAMHGFPQGVKKVLDDAFPGRANKQKMYLDLTMAMLQSRATRPECCPRSRTWRRTWRRTIELLISLIFPSWSRNARSTECNRP